MEEILSIKNLNKTFERGFKLKDINFDIKEGEVVSLIGESGSGKSILMRSIMSILPNNIFDKNDKFIFDGKEVKKGEKLPISMIFQNPMTSLDPVRTIGFHLIELIERFQNKSKEDAKKLAIEQLEKVGILNAPLRMEQYPHELSGGMRQRVMIAMAMSCKPSVLIADEPTTALDVTIQAQILDLIKGLQAEMHAGIILITHDLGVVAEMADRVAVLYAGEVVEIGTAEQIFKNPKHPYTRSLLRSIPQIDDEEAGDELYVIQGMVPSLKTLDRQGCRFANRIPWVKHEEHEHNPTLHEVEEGHHVRCTCYKNFEFEGEENNA